MLRAKVVATAVATVGVTLTGVMLLSWTGASLADAPRATFAERFYAVAVAAECSGHRWPYIAADCLRTADGTRARPARVIMIDRQAPAK